MMPGKIKFKLYTDDQGEPQVKVAASTAEGPLTYWREDGTLKFLELIAEDPDSNLIKVSEGVYQEPRM